MDYDSVAELRRRHPAWRLLMAEHAPLILSFLNQVFVEENVRSISADDLTGRLDDVLFAFNERAEGDAGARARFPRKPADYLNDWAGVESGWLRKYYPEGSDEPHFDAMPAVEKALSWVRSLQARPFVGTESRLSTIFTLLREMVLGADADPQVHLADLERRRLEIDEEIERIRAGTVAVMDPAALRDRYQQFAATARDLLSDFREVEANFRALDRDLRVQISMWGGSKGELLDEVLGSRESIAESDQGRSFRAFYDFLLSQARQEELAGLLDAVQNLNAIAEPDPRMRRIHYDWLEAGERTQSTVRRLSEQLSRFLDSQVWFENRRVMDILHSIEANALFLRDHDLDLPVEIDGTSPELVLPMERPLYTLLNKTPLDSDSVTQGLEEADDSALFEQVYVDSAALAAGVRHALRVQPQVALSQLVAARPLERGLAELVAYLSLSDSAFTVVFDSDRHETIAWSDSDGTRRRATVPAVTFARTIGDTNTRSGSDIREHLR